MATTFALTKTYAGHLAAPYLKQSLLQMNALTNGFFDVKFGVIGKQVMKRAVLSTDVLTDETCDFTPTSTVTIDEKLLEPKPLQVNIQMCKTDFIQDWEIENMGGSAWKNIPTNLVDWIIPQILANALFEVEKSIYIGVDANDGEFLGLETEIALDADLPAAQ